MTQLLRRVVEPRGAAASARRAAFRWLCLLLALLSVRPALGGEPERRPPPPRPPSAQAMVDAYLAALNAHDAEQAAGYLDAHITYQDARVPTASGRDAARREVIDAWQKAVPDGVRRRTASTIVASEGIAYQWVLEGTNTGDWSDGTKATGKAIKIEGATILRVRDYRILYQGDFYDVLALRRQLGLAP